ncbi:glutenin, low molecular weight subunit-like [Humulus lupulus]|uniref:glutenin, low molecular weight subunit-like n=1 Tax=Humulus lupulus TaxID=3486 RepID=UPI002B411AFD|nr:glutenin, low molecular weight subunit-like [Humulus lupulus]
MAKTTRKTGQTSGNVPNQPLPQGVAEDEPQVELEEEDMDSETLQTSLIADMDHQQRYATAALEAAIQLAQGQPAPASQPDQPPGAHPQQNPHSEHPQYHHNPPQPRNPQRPEQPPAAQQERPVQDPEQRPPSRAS